MKARLAFALMALSLGLAGCAKRDAGTSAGADAGQIVDAPVLAFLSEARALHHEANVHEASNDSARAVAALERLTRAARPHPGTTVPEVDEVLSDTHARLAEIHLRAADFEAAERDIKEGLNHAKEPTYFRGHLFEVAGIIEETRAASLADAGRPAEQARARERALSLLREAVEIQNKVITGDR